MATITTTIRWDIEELNDIKKAAKEIGLPVALYVKSASLKKARTTNRESLAEILKRADEEIAAGEYEVFDSSEEFLKDLRRHMKK